MTDIENFSYKTTEPSFFSKLKGLYWFTPKSRRLKEIKFEDEKIFISVMSGQELCAPIKECSFKYGIDKADRIEVYVTTQDKKIHFTEIPGTLDDDAWENIRSFIIEDCDANELTSAKVLYVLEHVKNAIDDPLGTVIDITTDIFSKSGSIKKKIIAGLCAILIASGCIYYFMRSDTEENEQLSCKLVTEILQENGDGGKCEKIELGNAIHYGDSTIFNNAKAYLDNENEINVIVTIYENLVYVDIPGNNNEADDEEEDDEDDVE